MVCLGLHAFAREPERNSELAAVERSVSRMHSAYVNAFIDGPTKSSLQAEQRDWSNTLKNCDTKQSCLMKMNKERLQLLNGQQKATPHAGFFDGRNGEIVMYPIGTQYLTQIRTAEATAARWTCQVSGISSTAGKHNFDLKRWIALNT
jgi:uncharacterized protein